MKKFRWSQDLKDQEKVLDKFLTKIQKRRCVLRILNVRRHYGRRLIEELIAKQNRRCAICGKPLDKKVQVDHKKSVKDFAKDTNLPLEKAYKQCHALKNLQAVHMKCNNEKRVVE